jgi:hypothetical protein
MSELYSTSPETSDITEPAADFGHEPERGREPAQDARSYSYQENTATTRGDYDNPAEQEAALEGDDARAYDDAELDAMLAEEERLPESRTRQEARADTWGDTADETDSTDLGSEYDGDLDAFLADEEQLPDFRTRQEARAETWGDGAGSGSDEPTADFSDPTAEYDGDLDALLADEERLPEPRTRQEARADTWDDTNGQDAGISLDASPTSGNNFTETPAGQETLDENARSGTSSSIAAASETTDADAVSMLDHAQGQAADNVSSPDQSVVTVHDQYGHDWPLTVVHLTAEDRTLGDDTLTGIGLKPTGEQLLDMEANDSTERRTDRLISKLLEHGDDIRDGSGELGEALEADVHPASGAGTHGEAYQGHPVKEEHHLPESHSVNDAAGAIVMTAIAGTAALWRLRNHIRRGE